MTASTLVRDLIARGVSLHRVGEDLSIDTPEGLITPGTLDEIRRLKAEILEVLSALAIENDPYQPPKRPREIAPSLFKKWEWVFALEDGTLNRLHRKELDALKQLFHGKTGPEIFKIAYSPIVGEKILFTQTCWVSLNANLLVHGLPVFYLAEDDIEDFSTLTPEQLQKIVLFKKHFGSPIITIGTSSNNTDGIGNVALSHQFKPPR